MKRLLALVVAAGCSHRAAPNAAAGAMQAASGEEVVATVDGRAIYASDVARQARARGVDAKQALSDLVDAEVLAGEAARRGLDRDLHVVDETKGALARRYLHETFEKELGPADVPEALVRREYQQKLAYLWHNTYADVWHILVPVDKTATADQKAAARARAIELSQKARGMTLDQFKQLGQSNGLRLEEIVTARDGWVQRPFSEAAFAQLKKPGDVTQDPPLTTFGYHVEYLVRWIPPEHVSFAEAAPKIRQSLWPAWQKRLFQKRIDDEMARHHVEEHPERLPKE